jgi:hypothetical protein
VSPEFTFPCRAVNKAPCRKGWRRELFQGVEWKGAELVGAQTGETNGFDVLDVDGEAGRAWYDANFDALPTTHAQETRRGVHLYFRAAPGLGCSIGKATSGIAPGVDVRAEGGYVILWGREGYPTEEAPICEWPDWLLSEAMAACGPQRKSGNLRQTKTLRDVGVGVVVAGAGDALRRMDPRDWRGDFAGWFALAGACKAVGIPRDEFADWSIGDPEYADRRGEIERIWDAARGEHGGALFKALSERGIKLSPPLSLSEVPTLTGKRKTLSWRARVGTMTSILHGNQIEPALFNVACVCAEIHAECGKPSREFAGRLLMDACPRLIAEIGVDEVRRTINNAFAHIAQKAAQ